MHATADHLAEYLQASLGLPLSPAPRPTVTRRLAPFLGHRYQFLEARLLDRAILFMVDEAVEEQPPTTIRKHIAMVQAKWNHPVVYVRDQITAYNRKRLIQHRVPFVVPGNQMYLPELGLDLRERFRHHRIEKTHFSPSTQTVLIHALLRDSEQPLVAADIAPDLGYSRMTVGRAFDALEAAGIGESVASARRRRFRLVGPRQEVWERAKPYLGNPVRRRYYIRPAHDELPGLQSGLSALARYAMIAEPQNPVLAFARDDWNALKQRVTVEALPEPDAIEVEVWSYPPRPYRDETMVDPLSLFLTLRDTTDERVEASLRHMIGSLPW